MEASFHVARTAAELILRRDKAAVPGRGRGGWPEKKKDVFGTLFQAKILKIGTQFQTVVQ